MEHAQKKAHLEPPHSIIDYMQLARSENVGPITFHQLIRKYGDPGKALKVLPALAAQGG